ncbi:unnamed protein product, partial [Discosporangium mesarthrocarpum]
MEWLLGHWDGLERYYAHVLGKPFPCSRMKPELSETHEILRSLRRTSESCLLNTEGPSAMIAVWNLVMLRSSELCHGAAPGSVSASEATADDGA